MKNIYYDSQLRPFVYYNKKIKRVWDEEVFRKIHHNIVCNLPLYRFTNFFKNKINESQTKN